MSIRLRLTLWYTSLLGITLVLSGLLMYFTVRYSLHNEVDHNLETRARQIQRTVQEVLSAQLSLEAVMSQTRIIAPPLETFSGPDLYIQVLTLDGKLLNASANLGGRHLPVSKTALERARQGRTTWDTWQTGAAHLRVYTTPLSIRGVVVASLQVGEYLGEVDRSLRQLSTILALLIAGALVLAAVMGSFLAQRAIAPVDQVTQAALHITRAEDLHRRLAVPGPADELGRLVEAINEMLDRLEMVFRSQQRFVADVSHELRTPLTAIQGNLDLLRIGAVDSPEDRHAALSALESEVARLSRMVNDLLFLARSDTDTKTIPQPVELDTLLLDIFRQAQILNEDVSLSLGHEDQALVMGNPDRLRQVLLNLVDNALKYTPKGGKVTLSLFRDKGWARVVVEDTGIGIPVEAIPHLFDRFYRVDKGRSRLRGGSGLGLAIAKEIAEAHGGHIEVESEEGKGSRFTVRLLAIETPTAAMPSEY